ncbi:MAG: dockerin type I domain-containing protein [Monoglobaceae bacterium]
MKKNLFKKVAAFVTAASMVASLGTVAFADNYYESGIKITNVNYQRADVAGEYDVTVSYSVDEGVTNDIGVTMLAYAGANLSVDASDYTKYNTSMQIVGIDQQEQTAQTGTFEFRVTTKDDGAIKVAYDVPSIILVSGDKVAPAAATLLITTPREEKTAASVEYTYGGTAVEYFSYEKAGLKDKVTATLADMSDTATLKDAAGNVIGTAPISGANIKTVVEKDADTYTVTATIPAGTTVTSDSYDVIIPAGGLDAVFDVAVGMVPWAVVSANYNAENTMTIEPQADADAVVTAIEAKLAEAGVTLKGADEKAVKKLAGDDLDVTVALAGDAAYDPTNTEDQVLTYTVTVNFAGDAEAAVTEDSVLAFELTVTISAAPAGTYGDVDNSGVVDMSDAALIMQNFLGIISSFEVDAKYADVDNSGVIDMSDAALVMQHFLGIISSFPAEN